jgi:hypothetical protein
MEFEMRRLAGVVGSLVFAGLAWGQSSAPQRSAPQPAEKSIEKSSAPASAELSVLDRFAGQWEVSEAHYNLVGEVVGSAKGIEEGAWILDGRALQRNYTTGVEGNLFRAVGTITWDAAEKQFEGMWFDNTSTNGPTAVSGTWDETTKTMTFTLTSTGQEGKPTQHKVIDRFLDDEHRVATTYRVVGSQVEKVIEVQFKRARPCPTNLGMVREKIVPAEPKNVRP